MSEPHHTIPMLIWADIDTGVADMVARLNRIDGVRTHASCQGGISYPAQVLVSWADEQTLIRIKEEFEIVPQGSCLGYARRSPVEHSRLGGDTLTSTGNTEPEALGTDKANPVAIPSAEWINKWR